MQNKQPQWCPSIILLINEALVFKCRYTVKLQLFSGLSRENCKVVSFNYKRKLFSTVAQRKELDYLISQKSEQSTIFPYQNLKEISNYRNLTLTSVVQENFAGIMKKQFGIIQLGMSRVGPMTRCFMDRVYLFLGQNFFFSISQTFVVPM